MKQNALVFLRTRSLNSCSEAFSFFKQYHIQVLARYGDIAFEVYLTEGELEVLRQSDLFTEIHFGKIGEQGLANLPPEPRQIANVWNVYLDNISKPAVTPISNDDKGISWAAEGSTEPLPFSNISEEFFLDTLQKKGFYPVESGSPFEIHYDRNRAKDLYLKIERGLLQRIKNETQAHHLAKFATLHPELEEAVTKLPEDVIEDLFNQNAIRRFNLDAGDLGPDEESCWRMNGQNSVGLVFVESSREDGPTFGSNAIDIITSQIAQGLNFMASENVHGNLSWVCEPQQVSIDVGNGSTESSEEYWWRPAMRAVRYHGNSYSGDWPGLARYRADMRERNSSAHAIAIFVTPYLSNIRAFSNVGRGRVIIARLITSAQILDLHNLIAHEVCHLYGASDEYSVVNPGETGTPCTSCSTQWGCDRVVNGNCEACARDIAACFMMSGSLGQMRMCSYTRKQVGWLPALSFHPSSLFFGTVNTGDTRVLQFTIRNRTGDTVPIRFATNLPGPLQWQPFNGELENGASRTFDVTFRPTSGLPVNARLSLIRTLGEPPGGPHFIDFSGRGSGGLPPV
jgi:hypothetical protein